MQLNPLNSKLRFTKGARRIAHNAPLVQHVATFTAPDIAGQVANAELFAGKDWTQRCDLAQTLDAVQS